MGAGGGPRKDDIMDVGVGEAQRVGDSKGAGPEVAVGGGIAWRAVIESGLTGALDAVEEWEAHGGWRCRWMRSWM